MVEEVSNAEALAILDGLSEEEYVFHGSPQAYDILRPQVPFQNQNLIEEYKRKGVHGTLMTEIALLYAVIHEPKDRWGWKIETEPFPQLFVQGPRRMRGGRGFVHICKRTSFAITVPPGLVCVSTKLVKPKRILCVQPNILEVLMGMERLAFR